MKQKINLTKIWTHDALRTSPVGLHYHRANAPCDLYVLIYSTERRH
jgi:hypothetical protein